MDIIHSVGNKGKNRPSDVKVVQRLISQKIILLSPLLAPIVDGDCGPITIGLIIEFQRRVLGFKRPDGLVDPKGRTFKGLAEKTPVKPVPKPTLQQQFDTLLLQVQGLLAQDSEPKVIRVDSDVTAKVLSESDYTRAAAILGVDVPAVKAVASVESKGDGFLKSGQPKILFEGHWFSKLTKGQYDSTHPTISYPKWTKKHYKGGQAEYQRYNTAKALEEEAAIKSTSWGKFQIMGFNHKACGYSTASDFLRDMKLSEAKQLNAFCKFVVSKGLHTALKKKDWAAFAKGYNGKAYKKNNYDVKLKQAYKAFSS